MTAYVTRQGSPYTGRVFTNAKGTPSGEYKHTCGRCGGAGRADKWAFTGYTCFDCGGAGHLGMRSLKLYTVEQVAKLDATKAKADAKRAAARAAKDAEFKLRADRERESFCARPDVAALIARTEQYVGTDDFITDVMQRAFSNAFISDKQMEAVTKACDRLEKKALDRATSAHVGQVGERLKNLPVTVERVSNYRRPCFNASWTSETVWIVTMRDEAGNAFVSKTPNFSAEKGERYIIGATVKEHSEFDGQKQTVVKNIRAKVAP